MSESGVVTAVAPGTATITAVATNGTVGKEDDKTVSCTVAVNKADSAVKAAPAEKTLTSNGNAQELVTAGTADGGTMQYALGTDAATAPTTGYSASIPTAIDAGTYYVWYKAIGDENHNDSDPKCVTVTISEKETPPATQQTEASQSQTEASSAQTENTAPEAVTERITILRTPAKIKAKAKKSRITVSWKRINKNKKTKAIRAMIKGVEVQYSTDPAFPKETTVSKTIGKNKTKYVIKGLNRKATYYVRVRYTDRAGGYSRWSKVKRSRTK